MRKPDDFTRFMAQVSPEPNSGCWLWTGTGERYGVFGHSGTKEQAHRFSYRMAKGEIPEGMSVCHKCDVPACVNPAHLFLGTHLENMQDRDRKGRRTSPKGETHYNSKLKPDEIRKIRELASLGVPKIEIARRVGYSRGAVRHVLSGHTWAHIV